MRVTAALSHYLQLLRQLDAGTQVEVTSRLIARNEHTRWTACVRANRDPMRRVQKESRQRRLHFLTCRLREQSMADAETRIQLELDLRVSSDGAMATKWLDENAQRELLHVGVEDK